MAVLSDLGQARSLLCFTSVKTSQQFVENFSDFARRWRRSIRALGGYWLGSFEVEGELDYLQDWFYNRLGYHIEERVGEKTWEGLVWEMDFTQNGVTRRRSLSTTRNAVKVEYVDNASAFQETAFATFDTSLNAYGRIEEILTLDQVESGQATAHRDTYLTRWQDPFPQLVGMQRRVADGLKVTVVGYVFTMNNKYITAAGGTLANLSDYLTEIIAADCEFVTAQNIASNTLQVKKQFDMDTRAWDGVIGFVEQGDANGDPYQFQVLNDRLAYYQKVAAAPVYFWHEDGLKGQIGGSTAVDPWTVVPGVVRDMTVPVSAPPSGSFLESGSDGWVTEVEMGDGMIEPMLKTELFDESELLAAQEAYQNWLESEEDA